MIKWPTIADTVSLRRTSYDCDGNTGKHDWLCASLLFSSSCPHRHLQTLVAAGPQHSLWELTLRNRSYKLDLSTKSVVFGHMEGGVQVQRHLVDKLWSHACEHKDSMVHMAQCIPRKIRSDIIVHITLSLLNKIVQQKEDGYGWTKIGEVGNRRMIRMDCSHGVACGIARLELIYQNIRKGWWVFVPELNKKTQVKA